jgi:hypothetical protein
VLGLVVLGFGTLAAPGSASASETIPQKIKDQLELDCAPACILCHTTPEGGLGTLKEPFGVYMRNEAGIFPDLPGKVEQALALAETHDADLDGVFDVAEIRANQDPGSPDNNPICLDANYGCGAQLAPQRNHGGSGGADWSFLAAACVGLLLLRRRLLVR